MAKTPAERQATYRQKHLHGLDGNKARLNLVIDHRAKLALARLAKRYGLTQTECLERLLLEAQTRELATMDAAESSAYYDSVTA
jgi:dephospho-CoA kinase